MGCRHGSVDSSAPSILPLQVRVPSTKSTLFSICIFIPTFHPAALGSNSRYTIFTFQSLAVYFWFFEFIIELEILKNNQIWSRLVNNSKNFPDLQTLPSAHSILKVRFYSCFPTFSLRGLYPVRIRLV